MVKHGRVPGTARGSPDRRQRGHDGWTQHVAAKRDRAQKQDRHRGRTATDGPAPGGKRRGGCAGIHHRSHLCARHVRGHGRTGGPCGGCGATWRSLRQPHAKRGGASPGSHCGNDRYRAQSRGPRGGLTSQDRRKEQLGQNRRGAGPHTRGPRPGRTGGRRSLSLHLRVDGSGCRVARMGA